jgi:hypothetical protein
VRHTRTLKKFDWSAPVVTPWELLVRVNNHLYREGNVRLVTRVVATDSYNLLNFDTGERRVGIDLVAFARELGVIESYEIAA